MKVMMIREIVFIVFLVLVSIIDIKQKRVNINLFIIYFLIGIILLALNLVFKGTINLYDISKSIIFGLLIIFISIITNNGVGRADGLYFLINSLYVSFSMNIYLFISGLYILFLISIIIYIKRNGNIKHLAMPFLPCLLPYAIWSLYAHYRG